MKSLLAHIYPMLKSTAEDLATESLLYLIQYSDAAKKEFVKLAYRVCGSDSPGEEIRFRTQASGINLERPNMVGFNTIAEEMIICESKFYAGLTGNQPVEYMKRLLRSSYHGNKVLLIICPEIRKESLWNELMKRCRDELQFAMEISPEYWLNVNGVRLGITSWKAVLNVLQHVFTVEHNSSLLADLKQLQGLCEKMDSEAFLPIRREELGIDVAKRMLGYYALLDKITDHLKSRLNASTDNTRPSPMYGGYIRYMIIGDYGVSLQFNLKYWIEKAETPIWLGIYTIIDGKWVYSSKTHESLKQYEHSVPKRLFISDHSQIMIPLFLPTGVDENHIIEKVVNDISAVFDEIKASARTW